MIVVSSLRQAPKPGYTLAPRSHTFSSVGGASSQAALTVRNSFIEVLKTFVAIAVIVSRFSDKDMIKIKMRLE